MRSEIVARNYADTLLALAMRNGGQSAVEAYERDLSQVAGLLEREPRIREFMESPRIPAETRVQTLRRALGGSTPEPFLRFLLVVAEKRRQAYLRDIAAAYRDRVDAMLGRVRVQVELPYEPDEALRREIAGTLEARFGRTVIPTFTVDPALIGGIVVRHGDLVLDGSLRTRAAGLRNRLRAVRMPALAPAA